MKFTGLVPPEVPRGHEMLNWRGPAQLAKGIFKARHAAVRSHLQMLVQYVVPRQVIGVPRTSCTAARMQIPIIMELPRGCIRA